MEEIRPNTIFCDIDGTLVKQNTAAENAQPDLPLILLPGIMIIEKQHTLFQMIIGGYEQVLVMGPGLE